LDPFGARIGAFVSFFPAVPVTFFAVEGFDLLKFVAFEPTVALSALETRFLAVGFLRIADGFLAAVFVFFEAFTWQKLLRTMEGSLPSLVDTMSRLSLAKDHSM